MHEGSIPLISELVLLGGGHAHALVLRRWGMAPVPGVRLTLINPGPTAPYTGMLPGHVAGHYARDALDIDLVRLARFAGARLVLGAVDRIDPVARALSVPGRAPIAGERRRVARDRRREAWRAMGMRAMGMREIVTSAGILLQPHQSGWRLSRVAGDLLDLSLLTWISRGHPHRRLTTMTALVAGLTALDTLAACDNRRQRAMRRDTPDVNRIHRSLHIQRPAEACYRFWRNFENFPQFMQHVEAVQVVDTTRTHWCIRTPVGQHVEWTAELFSDIPSQQLAWRTLGGSAIEHIGIVRFLPALNDKSTRLDIEMRYEAASGKAGVILAKIFDEQPSQQMDDDLRRFKQLMETGEIATTTGQSAGRRSTLAQLMHWGVRS